MDTEFVNIDSEVQALIDASGLRDGVCRVFVPHTTAGVTINENADPDVVRDMELILDRMAPWEGGYAHAEGNSAAHVKAKLFDVVSHQVPRSEAHHFLRFGLAGQVLRNGTNHHLLN